MPQSSKKPILLVDIDGVISLFGFESYERPDGVWHNVEGVPHFLSSTAAAHLHDLAECFDLVWCSGWEEKADEHLPTLLGVPVLPHLSFDRNPGRANAHWKLAAIDAHVGRRPVAWIDDALDDGCDSWARARDAAVAPTLLVHTDPRTGITDEHVATLRAWATDTVPACGQPGSPSPSPS